ncbi:MAG TPA: NUDIX hydrolase [Candidatus Paceibacterota bacterium]
MAKTEDTKKVVVSRGIFLDEEGKVLLVKINDTGGFVTPGGRVELNESPKTGLQREIKEEISLDWTSFEFMAVDFLPGKAYDQENGAICFVFYCGILNEENKKKIIIQEGELSGHGFYTLNEAEKLMSAHGFRRLREAVSAHNVNEAIYLEDGYRVGLAL